MTLETSNGSTASYYELPPGANQLQDLISLEAERDALAAELKALREQEPVARIDDDENFQGPCRHATAFVPMHRGTPLYARPAPDEPVNARLLEALKKCRDQFQRYVEHHLGKGDHDKAAANESFAWLAGAAISEAEKQPAEAGDCMDKRVLDPCCGSRMFYFDRKHPDVVFGDRRHETITVTDRSHGNESGTRTLHIEPDVLMDFRDIPYPDGTFKLVSFDPPHLVRAGPKSWLAAKYGKLGPDWREDIRQGFAECFRVLAPDGVLVFKWNETQVKVSDVLALTAEKPIFGQVAGRGHMTHWLVFMKPMQPLKGGD